MSIVFDGTYIIIELSNWQGFLILFWIFGEIISLYLMGMSIIHRFIVAPIIIWQINRIKPNHWKINYRYVYQFLFMKRKSKGRYDVWIDLYAAFSPKNYSTSKIGTNYHWCYEIISHCVINRWGKIVKTDLEEEILRRDTLLNDKIKEWNRDTKLKKLGLK